MQPVNKESVWAPQMLNACIFLGGGGVKEAEQKVNNNTDSQKRHIWGILNQKSVWLGVFVRALTVEIC